MIIAHKINDFLFTIFKIDNEREIIQKLTEYYTYNNHIPIIRIEDEFVYIEIEIDKIISEDTEYKNIISLCETGKFNDAKSKLEKLISKNPTNSEYYRILGQIYSEEGNQEEAVNNLIDSLKWNSKNSYALLMMGNIFAKFKNDIATAMKYYDQALIVNPSDNITMNNIGANLLQQNKFSEAEKYFYKALSINDKYPNTHYALGIISKNLDDNQSAFFSFIKALINCPKNIELYQIILNELIETSNSIINNYNGKNIYEKFRFDLEALGGIDVDITHDSSIFTNAKIEFAQNYDRSKHIIKYKNESVELPHLIMHELVHLKFVIEAQQKDSNLLFISSQQQQNIFEKDNRLAFEKMRKLGISKESIKKYSTGLFNGLNSQIFNAPIDLFIEQFLFEEFIELRPFQFISLLKIIQEGLIAVTDKKVIEISPSNILSKSKIYNLVSALQLKDIFGVDLLENFKASKLELEQAEKFYKEFLEYRDDREPAEEYELVQNWANDLKLSDYFELIGENQYKDRSNIDDFIKKIENDPFGEYDKDPVKEREMNKFIKGQEEIGLNMAVVMFMVSALEFFSNKSNDEIKNIAFEIALQGSQGYNPNVSNYKLSSIPNTEFSGYHILAYYYVSWAIAIPEMLSEIQLPFEQEYKMALTLFKPIG